MKIKVPGLLLDEPAHLAGIRQGDEVLAVNGVDARGKSAFEVSALLQGPNETFVIVKIKHGNWGPVESIKVQRQVLARTPVFYRLEQMDAASSVGYIRLKEFNALAKKDLATAMKRLEAMGASYFVLELRDNLGGLGLIQSVFELHDGSGVAVTVGKYVTPNHEDINGKGIEPDFQNFPAWSVFTERLSQCSISFIKKDTAQSRESGSKSVNSPMSSLEHISV